MISTVKESYNNLNIGKKIYCLIGLPSFLCVIFIFNTGFNNINSYLKLNQINIKLDSTESFHKLISKVQSERFVGVLYLEGKKNLKDFNQEVKALDRHLQFHTIILDKELNGLKNLREKTRLKQFNSKQLMIEYHNVITLLIHSYDKLAEELNQFGFASRIFSLKSLEQTSEKEAKIVSVLNRTRTNKFGKNKIEKAFNLQLSQLIQSLKELQNKEVRSLLIISLVFMTSLLILYYFSKETIKSIVLATQKIQEFATKLELGDLTFNIDVNSKDEIGQTIDSLNMASRSLNKLVSKIKEDSINIKSKETQLNKTASSLVDNFSSFDFKSQKISDDSNKIKKNSIETTRILKETEDKISTTHKKSSKITKNTKLIAGHISKSVDTIGLLSNDIQDISESVEFLTMKSKENKKNVSNVQSSIQNISKNIESVAKHIEYSVNLNKNITTSIKAIFDSIKNGSTESTDTSHEMHFVVESINEISQILHNITKKAKGINNNVEYASSSVKEMQLNLSDVLSKTHDSAAIILTASNNSKQSLIKMNKLVKSVHEIDGMVLLIESIARETNLLALNATLESTRAGKYGLGFAAVADQVNQLSNKTRINTLVIKRKTSEIKESTIEAVRLVEDITSNVNQANEVTNSVAKSVQNQLEITNDICNIMNTATSDIKQLTNLVTTCSDSSTSITTVVESSSQNLDHLANDFLQVLKSTDNTLADSKSFHKSLQTSSINLTKMQLDSETISKEVLSMQEKFIKMDDTINLINENGKSLSINNNNIHEEIDYINQNVQNNYINICDISGLISEIFIISKNHIKHNQTFSVDCHKLSIDSNQLINFSSESSQISNQVSNMTKDLDHLSSQMNENISGFIIDNQNIITSNGQSIEQCTSWDEINQSQILNDLDRGIKSISVTPEVKATVRPIMQVKQVGTTPKNPITKGIQLEQEDEFKTSCENITEEINKAS